MGELLGATLGVALFGYLVAWMLRKLTRIEPAPALIVSVPVMVLIAAWLYSQGDGRYDFWEALALYGLGGAIALPFMIVAERRRRRVEPTAPLSAAPSAEQTSPVATSKGSSRQAAAIVLVGMGAFALYKATPWALGFLGGKSVVESLISGPPSLSEMEANLEKKGYTLYGVIKQELPQEYVPLMEELRNAFYGGEMTEDEAVGRGVELLSALRHKYASKVRISPDAEIRQILKYQIDLVTLVRKIEPTKTCNEFVIDGPLALGAKPDARYLQLLNDAGVALIKAIGGAMRNGQQTQAPSDDDWEVFGEHFVQAGGSLEELNSLAAQDVDDANLCPAALRFFTAVMSMPGEAGRRLRAEVVHGLAAS